MQTRQAAIKSPDQVEARHVRDGSRLISFEGRLLSTVSSERPGTPRWTEMRLFRTVGGSYVLEKVGRSIMTHMPGCSRIIGRIPRFQEAHPGDDPEDGYWYCDCVPEEYDLTQLLAEEDRYWAVIADQPERVVEALYRKKEGSRYLPRISLDLLERAADSDPSLGDAYLVEKIS